MRQTNTVTALATLLVCLLLSCAQGANADIPVNQNYFGLGAANAPTYTPGVNTPNASPTSFQQESSQAPARIDVDEIDSPASVINRNPAPVNQPVINSPQTNAMPLANPSIPSTSFGAPNGGGLRISFQTPFDSTLAKDGDPFIASATDDFWLDNKLIVPKGSVLRGRINVTKKAGLINKSQDIVLNFDHMMMPDGSLKNLNYQMTPSFASSSVPISGSQQFAYGLQQAGQSIQSQAQHGVEVAQDKGGGFNYLLAVPAYTLKGVANGTLITTDSATRAIFGNKSENLMVRPGDEFVIEQNEAAQLLFH